MIYITLGLHCSAILGIKYAGLRKFAYLFDWMWTPSKTTYDILNILINDNIENAVEYMINGWNYYDEPKRHYFVTTDNITKFQQNKITGFGIPHYTIDENFQCLIRRRLERLLNDIKSNEHITFIYADAPIHENYYLDNVEYGLDATDYLIEIYNLIYPLNNNIDIIYFCWEERKRENNIIKYYPFAEQNCDEVSIIIKNYLTSSICQPNEI